MVLKARDYGFIGLKLKGLIFSERNESARHEYLAVGADICSLKMRSGRCKFE